MWGAQGENLLNRVGYPHNYFACVAAVVCILFLALFFPTEGEVISNNTSCQITPGCTCQSNQKLVFTYVLVLVTMAILRM